MATGQGCGAATKCPSADYCNLPVATKLESLVDELCLMLMPVKTEAKPSVDQDLESVGIHIVERAWPTACVVMPDSQQESSSIGSASEGLCCMSDAVGMNCPLLVQG